MNHSTFKPLYLIAAALLVVNGCSSSGKKQAETSAPADEASVTQTASQAPRTAVEVMDELALNQLHHINQKEITMAELAEKKAQSPEVKTNSQSILSDHRALEEQLKTSAQQQNITLAEFTPSTYERTAMSRLEALEGAEFDRAFVNQMVYSHQMAADQLKMTRKHVKNAQVSNLIDQALPKIQQHRHMTKELADTQGFSKDSNPAFAE